MCNAWCHSLGERLRPLLPVPCKVLEVGSRNVNGTLRPAALEPGSVWLGVDIAPGPGVDQLLDATRLTECFASASFDCTVCTEMLEHCLDWRRALLEMFSVTKPGGLLLLTTRSPGFPLHEHPADYWRFTTEHMRHIFSSSCEILALESDNTLGFPCGVGVLARVRPNATTTDFAAALSAVTPETVEGAPPAELESLTTVIFDQHSRYSACAAALQRMAGRNDTVLDIGSGPVCLLGRYTQGLRVSYLDPLLAGHPVPQTNHIPGDLAAEELHGKRFDFVTCVDALEHIPADGRSAFLDRLCDLAGKGLVLAFPAADFGQAQQVDKACDDFFRAAFGRGYPWLDEHQRYGLPRLEQVLRQLQQRGLRTSVRSNGHAPWLRDLLPMVLCLLESPMGLDAVRALSQEFNRDFAPHDAREPGYRAVVSAWREDSVQPAPEPMPQSAPPAPQAWEAFLFRAQAQVHRLLHQQTDELRQLADELHQQRAQINDFAAHVAALRTTADAGAEALHARQPLAGSQELFDQLRQDVDTQAQNLADTHAQLMRMSDWAAQMRDRLAVVDSHRLLWAQERLLFSLRQRGPLQTALGVASFLLPAAAKRAWTRLALRRSLQALRNDVAAAPEKVIVALPIIPWTFRWQRPQQLLSRLAGKGWTVLYVNPSPRRVDDKCAATDPLAGVSCTALAGRVWDLSLSSCEDFRLYEECPTEGCLQGLVRSLVATLTEAGASEPVFLVQFPSWAPLALGARQATGGSLVFDCMDDHSGFANTTRAALEAEEELTRKADLVLTTSDTLHARAAALNPAALMVRNGTEFEHFHAARRNGRLDHLAARPVIGYYGAISTWFDTDLVLHCAKARPQWSFVLIGATCGSDAERLSELPNVHLLGEVPYAKLPGYFAYFDVCTIPFKLVPLIMATNPVKFYEYLSDAKPVVSVNMPELRPHADLCYLADDAAGFLRQLDAALAERPDPELRRRRLDLARSSSWDARIEELLHTQVFRRGGAAR